MCGFFVVISSVASTLEATRDFKPQIEKALTLRGNDLYTNKESSLVDGFTSIAHHSLLSIYGWDRDLPINNDMTSIDNNSLEVEELNYNGEIYSINGIMTSRLNYCSDEDYLRQYIKSIDTDSSQSILRLHRDVDGQFAFLYHTDSFILMARDYHGQKPLFYHISGDLLVASSSLSLLRNYLSFISSKNHPLLSEHNLQIYDLPLSSEPISKLACGSSMLIRINEERLVVTKSLCFHHYYQMFDDHGDPPRIVASVLRQRFTSAVSSILPRSKPYSLLLSGGYDSAALLYELVQQNRPPIVCITYANGYNSADVEAAARLARFFKLKHHVIKTSPEAHRRWKLAKDNFDLPTDPASEALYHLLNVASSYSRIVLCGDGGDEISRRYRRFLYYRSPLKNLFLLQIAFKNLLLRFSKASLSALIRTLCESLCARHTLDSCHKISHKSNISLDDYYISNHIHQSNYDIPMSYELMVNLPERLLAKSDQISYSVGVELRTPFLCRTFSSYIVNLNRNTQRINASRLLVARKLRKLLSSSKAGLA